MAERAQRKERRRSSKKTTAKRQARRKAEHQARMEEKQAQYQRIRTELRASQEKLARLSHERIERIKRKGRLRYPLYIKIREDNMVWFRAELEDKGCKPWQIIDALFEAALKGVLYTMPKKVEVMRIRANSKEAAELANFEKLRADLAALRAKKVS